ncbi:AAA family ATPase [Haliscomenobacter sp.]|uniref:AAA family ATPase n=1 Tax=Haliscomenobacter sp. TaxID=2717303 RepID=UPI003BA866D2
MSTGRATGKEPNFGLNGQVFQQQQVNWALIESFDWIEPLRTCPQEPEHHGEGDVWTHTRMVIEALLGLPAFQELAEREQSLLFHAALLHDVAKPQCTIIENGKISSPRHAKIGEKVAREILWDCEIGFREEACALVRQHGLPLWIMDKPDPIRAAILASWRVRNELTYLLAKADVLGRISTTCDELMYRADLFQELCLDNHCFEKEATWFNAHSRYRYFWSEETYPVEIFDDTAFEVIILSGIAGSGKDTFYAKNYAHLPVVSLDEIRRELKIRPDDRDGQGKVAQVAYERAKEFCRRKKSFVWNSTNLTSELRARLHNALRVYNPRFKIVYLETSQENIFSRRKEDIKSSVLTRMIGQLDMPLVGEGHEVRWVRS